MCIVIASSQWGIIAAVAVVILIFLALFIYKESTGFRVVHYSFVNDRLKKDSYRFAMISDMHDCVYGKDNSPVLEAIDRERPEAVLLAGDMVTSYMEPEYHDGNALRFIGALAEKYPVYYGIGNHEDKLICHRFQNSDRFFDIYGRLKFGVKSNPRIFEIPIAMSEYPEKSK